MQPWVCTSLPRLLWETHGLVLIIFILFSALTALLTVIALPFLRRRSERYKYHPITTFVLIFFFLLFSPVALIQLTLAQQGIKMTSNVVKCLATNAPDRCYTFAAITSTSQKHLAKVSFDNGFAICNLTTQPEKCKVQVCDYIQVEEVTSSQVERLSLIGEDEASRTAQLQEVQQNCWEQVAPICPDGNILENIPCGCYSPELGRYTVHSTYWQEEYWEKYRKMDPKPFCCNGEKSTFGCY